MILRSVKEFLREYCIKVVDCYVFSLFRLCLCWEFWFCYYFFNYFLIIFIVIRYIFEDILLIIVYLIVNLIILFVIVELLINSGVYKC